MSQGKLNAIPPGTGGVAGQLATSKTADAIAQQGMASAQPTPPIGTMPGTFGRPGGSVQQPALAQFDGIGATAPVAPMTMPGVQMGTMEDKRYQIGGPAKYMPGLGPGSIGQPGGSLPISTPFNPGSMYTGGVNTPAPEDELDGLGGPDSMGQGITI